ncbi:MAG: 16S rRNA (adenine(1518)-N(6)/adenine(1519)-N(6))-dimethyltransferase RsmA [bacterium]
MDEYFSPKKSLGQNFLTSEGALQKIVETAEINENDVILEVGPGKGALTLELLHKKPKKILAIEKDKELTPLLEENFKKYTDEGILDIQNGDILDFEPEDNPTLKDGYKIVANIPYYITGHFIRKFLTTQNKPSKMVILVQKEVAERIVARDDKESLLSISVKVFGEPKYITTVKKGSFFPVPNVDSAVLLIDKIKRDSDIKDGDRFFQILHAGFAQKRKMLLGNLADTFGGREQAEQKLNICKIDTKKRAEDIKLEDWLCLANK